MSRVLYTPQLSQPFGTLKNTDLNTNLAMIRDAFDTLTAQAVSVASAGFGSTSGPVNMLFDLTSVASDGTYVTAELPRNPAIGDPWVTVGVQQTGVGVTTVGSVVVLTGDGNLIEGIATAVGYDGLPFLTNPGDTLTFAFVGGSLGWVIVDAQLSSYATPAGVVTLQTWDNTQFHVFNGLNSIIDTTSTPTLTLSLAGINNPGMQASFMIGPGSGPRNVATSSGAQFFNNVGGVFTMSVQYRRYLFTCTSVNHFTVTTSA